MEQMVGSSVAKGNALHHCAACRFLDGALSTYGDTMLDGGKACRLHSTRATSLDDLGTANANRRRRRTWPNPRTELQVLALLGVDPSDVGRPLCDR